MRSFWLEGLAAAAVAAAGLAAPALATVKDGVDAWQAQDYPRAVQEWRAPAEAGDADAQFNLAQAYKLGRGVPVNLATAQGWYEKAADQGHEQAQANLGLILFQNGDRDKAMPWIRKAADLGEPRAQYVLGTALFNGDFAPKDWPRAYALMTRAAAAGLPQAANSLAEMDKYIPLGQRQQGVAIARTLTDAKAGNHEQTAQAAPPAPPSIRPVELPASTPYAAANPVVAAVPTQRAPRGRGRGMVSPPTPIAPVPVPIAMASAAPPPPVLKRMVAAAKPAPALAAAGGRWRVQLGAFATPGAAETAWTKVGGALGGLRPSYIKAGAITRLQAGPLGDRTAAARACAAAKGTGTPCIPVAP